GGLCDGGGLRCAATMREPRQIPGGARHLDCLERLAQRPDLVDLDENRVADAILDAAGETFRIRDEDVVADELAPLAEGARELGPSVPIVFGEAVLDRHDGILVEPR